MITAYLWNPQEKKGIHLSSDQLESLGVCCDGNKVLWIDLANPTVEEETRILQKFMPIHALSFEDVTRSRREPDAPPHLPKVEEFPDYLLVIVNALRRDYLRDVTAETDELRVQGTPFTQLSAVITEHALITHHYHEQNCVRQVTEFLERHQGQAERGPDFIFHLILDTIVDQFAPVLDGIDESLEDMELSILQSGDPVLYRKLLRIKREIILLRKILIYQREILIRLARGEFQLIDEREMVYYRNVYDHLVRFTELIESSREMASDLLGSYLASASNRLNQIMKVLTMISTIVLPMTLVAGIYGMNFENLPEKNWEYGYPFSLGLMGLCGLASLGLFYWKKWL